MARTYIVADASSNHMGDLSIACTMIEAAGQMGVDCVKFQSWTADALRPDFPNYRKTYERHQRTQISDEDHHRLIQHCRDNRVDFLTTCFDLNRVPFLAALGLGAIKVASPDCGSIKLLEALMKHFKRLIISTGMTTEEEVRTAVEVTRGHDVVFLHCVSLYPTPVDRVHLNRMDWLRHMGVRVGFSDHTIGTDAGRIAIARGAEILEKHFTLSRQLPGKDQAVSAEPAEFAELVRFAGACEVISGRDNPPLAPEEMDMRKLYVGKWGDNR